MREIIKKITVYKFEELSDKAKEKALMENYDVNVSCNWWDFDGIMGFNQEELNKAKAEGIVLPVISADVESFDLDQRSYLTIKNIKYDSEDRLCNWLKIPKKLHNYTSIRFSKFQGSTSIDVSIEMDVPNETPQYLDFIQNIVDRAETIWADKIEDALIMLRDNYEYLTSDEVIIEYFNDYEIEFTADGKIYND